MLAVVVIQAGAQLAAQPGVEEHPLQLAAELPLPALFQFAQQWQQQLLAEGARRIQGQVAVEQIVQLPLRQLQHGFEQLLALLAPLAGLGLRYGVAAAEQFIDLTDRDATVEPGEDGLDARHVFAVVQTVTLGRAAGHDQAVAALPGAQGDRVDAGLAGHVANRQPALVQGCLVVVRQLEGFRWHCADSALPDAAAGRPGWPRRSAGGGGSDA